MMERTQEATALRKEATALRRELAEQKTRMQGEAVALKEQVSIPLYDVGVVQAGEAQITTFHLRAESALAEVFAATWQGCDVVLKRYRDAVITRDSGADWVTRVGVWKSLSHPAILPVSPLRAADA